MGGGGAVTTGVLDLLTLSMEERASPTDPARMAPPFDKISNKIPMTIKRRLLSKACWGGKFQISRIRVSRCFTDFLPEKSQNRKVNEKKSPHFNCQMLSNVEKDTWAQILMFYGFSDTFLTVAGIKKYIKQKYL